MVSLLGLVMVGWALRGLGTTEECLDPNLDCFWDNKFAENFGDLDYPVWAECLNCFNRTGTTN